MPNTRYGKRRQKKVEKRSRPVRRDRKGAIWAGPGRAKGGTAVDRDLTRGGQRIRMAARRRITQASDRIRSRRLRRVPSP